MPSKIVKVIALKGMRKVGQMEGAERGTVVTMALTVSASGNSVPPFYLFPRKNMQATFMDNVSPGTDMQMTLAGCANQSLLDSIPISFEM